MGLVSAALEEVIRRRVDHDDRLVHEIVDLKHEVERLRVESAKDRFWTHIGVEATLIALGIAWWTFPRQTSLGGIEGLGLLMGASVFALVTVGRRLLSRQPGA
jgi:hypothetical protein